MSAKMTVARYELVPLVACACGCGTMIKSVSRFYRPKKYADRHFHRKYANPKEYQQVYRLKNLDRYRRLKKNRARRIKRAMVIASGGECIRCGLTMTENNEAVFQFDHREPKEKLFNLSRSELTNRKLSDLELERKKCDLLCANCHILRHYLETYK